LLREGYVRGLRVVLLARRDLDREVEDAEGAQHVLRLLALRIEVDAHLGVLGRLATVGRIVVLEAYAAGGRHPHAGVHRLDVRAAARAVAAERCAPLAFGEGVARMV